MKRLSFALALLGLPLLSFAQASKVKNTALLSVEASLEKRKAVKKDFTVLEKVFSDDLVYTHSNGKQNDKTEYLQSIRDGKSVYDKIDVENINVRAYNGGTAAAVNGQIVIYQPNKPDGTPNVAHIKYVTMQIKDPKKGWQVVLWQSQKQPEAAK
jgi:hypothetical protein